VALREGETLQDQDLEIVDLSGSFRFARESYGSVGYTAVTGGIPDILRVGSTVRLDARSSLEPVLRFSRGKIYDISLGWRFRF
jgi:hypothetical protein